VGKSKGGHAGGFGDRVRSLRAAVGLTQAELAEHAGVSERTISDLERGLRGSIYPATARNVAATLGVSPAELPRFLSEARGRPAPDGRDELDAITWDRGGRVPIPLTQLLGREADLALSAGLVKDPGVRLVTIVGPGGIGKTRLAIEVANTVEEGFAGGSYFVDLSATDDPGMVLPLVAKAVGVAPETGALREALSRHIGGNPALVLLDTLEHLVAAAPAIGGLLEACPSLTILATSRTPLHLRGEREVPLLPLVVRSETDKPTAPAVELFIERAAAVEPRFDVSAAAVEVASDICARLDGLPLAIELAAARVRHMPLADLRRQLHHRLDPLVGGARDLPVRQQTMRGTLDWSYALLGASEMHMFRSLAAFRGGFGRDALGAISRPPEAGDSFDPIPTLVDLVDSSLVLPGVGAAGEARYRLLDVTREYAVERSTAAGEFEGLRRRHADFYLALAQLAEPELRGTQQREWYARLHHDEGNFRSALTWALEVGEAEVALRLAGALWMFWRWAGLFAEGRAWLDAALAAGEQSPLPVRCQGLWGAGWLAWHQGDYARTGELGRQMLAALAGREDKLRRRNALTLVGHAALGQERDADAIAALQEALSLCEGEGTTWHLATSLLNLGTALLHAGDAGESRRLNESALAMYEELGDQHFAARTLIQVGYACLVAGEPELAVAPITRAMQMAAEIGDGWGIAEGLEAVATLRSQSDPWVAALLAGAATQVRERISMRQHPPDAVINRRYLEQARERMGVEEFDAASAEGRAMPIGDVLELVLA
jgi:predicted ATPase/DNA-binding XRE family transcriptional regulator